MIEIRIFRGWYVVSALFVCAFMMFGAGMYSFLLILGPLSEQFNWHGAATGGLVSAFWIAAPISLMAGTLTRRFPLRNLVATGIVIEAVAVAALFFASDYWQIYLMRVFAGLGKVLFAVALPVILSKWFSRRFGTAIGIVYSGWFLSGVFFSPATHRLIDSVGWRAASIILGAAVLVVALPVALYTLRLKSAADIGLELDGAPISGGRPLSVSGDSEGMATRDKVGDRLGPLRARDAQLAAIARGFYYAALNGAFLYEVMIVRAYPDYANIAPTILAATSGAIAAGGLLGGLLIDRLSWRSAMAIQFTLGAFGILSMMTFTFDQAVIWLILFAVCFGLAGGGSDPFWATTLKRIVPPENFALVWGPTYFFGLVADISLTVVFGWLSEVSGGYLAPLFLSLALLTIPLTICLSRPLRKLWITTPSIGVSSGPTIASVAG